MAPEARSSTPSTGFSRPSRSSLQRIRSPEGQKPWAEKGRGSLCWVQGHPGQGLGGSDPLVRACSESGETPRVLAQSRRGLISRRQSLGEEVGLRFLRGRDFGDLQGPVCGHS